MLLPCPPRSLLVFSLFAGLSMLIGCGGGGAGGGSSLDGGGGGGGPVIPDAENGTARVDVDVATGKVVVTPLGSNSRSMYTGSAIGITSSNLFVDEGELTVRKLKLTLQNNTADRIGSEGGARLVVDRISTDFGSDLLDLRNYTQVSTRAGLSGSANDGPALSVVMNRPIGIAVDGADLLVAGRDEGRLRRLANGYMSTVTTGLLQPHGVAVVTPGQSAVVVEGTGHRITRVDLASGAKTILAGSGSAGLANGTGAAATFNTPRDVVVDGGTAYISDQANNAIRKATGLTGSSATVSTLKQDPNLTPTGIGMYDHNGVKFLLVTCTVRHKIYGMDPATGEFWTIAGNNVAATVDGRGDTAQFNNPADAVELNGAVYVSETGGQRVRQLTLQDGQNPRQSQSWRVKEIAGATSAGNTDGTGLAARFNGPQHIAASGNELYMTEFNLNRTRRITPSSGVFPIGQNNEGNSGAVKVANPTGYVPNTNLTLEAIPYLGINTIAAKGESGDTIEQTVTFAIPQGVKAFSFIVSIVGESDTASLLDAVLNASSPGAGSPNVNVRTLAGGGLLGWHDGQGLEASVNEPWVAATDAGVFIADAANACVRFMDYTGRIITIAGVFNITGGPPAGGTGSTCVMRFPSGITSTDESGTELFVVDHQGHVVYRMSRLATADPFNPDSWTVAVIAGLADTIGSAVGTGTVARFDSPGGIVVDSSGRNIYVADRDNHTIKRMTYSGGNKNDPARWMVRSFAGANGIQGDTDAVGENARFRFPNNVCLDKSSNLYVVEDFGHRVRKVTPDQTVSLLAGSASATPGFGDGIGAAARFNRPISICYDSTGYLYVADSENRVLRRISVASGEVKTVAGVTGQTTSANGLGSSPVGDVKSVTFNPARGLVFTTGKSIRLVERIVRNGQ